MISALHLFANHKITGPAELALETARWLPIADPDVSCRFASSAVPRTENRAPWLQDLARERGLPEAGWDDITLPKHFAPITALRDVRRMIRRLRADPPQVIHTHTENDHLLAGLAARRLERPIPIVRTLYDGEPPRYKPRTWLSYGHLTSRLICLSAEVARQMTEAPYNLPAERVTTLAPPIDTERFDPARELPNLRERFGIAADAPVYGIVARMQTHRRFEVLVEAMTTVARERPEARAIIVGRGTNQETVARAPVRDAGLDEHVIFSGYLKGDDYVGVLKALDLKLFLVPGSDGTCRAVREALSMGAPVVAARRGMLPEIVRDGVTGRVIDDTPETLAATILELLGDRELRERLGRQAREDAEQRFAFRAYARQVAAIYRTLPGLDG